MMNNNENAGKACTERNNERTMANVLDYKKEYKELYSPKNQPVIIEVPEITFVAVEGRGNPNDENGEYSNALKLLYGIQYTIKMSKKGNNVPDGYFDYVVPPLEGLWWFDNSTKNPPKDKSQYNWISIIRLPEYVTRDVFQWACTEVKNKKKIETDKVKYIKIKEGLCVQCMHIGSFDEEAKTVKLIEKYIEENNLINDLANEKRKHHEIYLSDPRKTEKS
ncbi:MAG: GyrI-like domain-containing protein, partial [Dysgonamonadaceae bacterium]|nr:GyrI-like domain-containing protein [Dysgonamonadaceae bacterium]